MKTKRMLSLLVCAALCAGLLPNAALAAGAASQDYEAANLPGVVTDIRDLALSELGTFNPLNTQFAKYDSFPYYQGWTQGKGNKIYFDNMLFRVLRYDEDLGVLVESDKINKMNIAFTTEGSASLTKVWSGGYNKPRSLCQEYYAGLGSRNQLEQGLILKTTTKEKDYRITPDNTGAAYGNLTAHLKGPDPDFPTYNFHSQGLVEDYVFILSAAEAAGCYHSTEAVRKEGNPNNYPQFFIRDVVDSTNGVATINGTTGQLAQQATLSYSDGGSIAYAMNLAPEKIAFLTEGGQSKPGWSADMQQTGTNSSRIWKITAEATDVDFSEGGNVTVNGSSVTADHKALNGTGYNAVTARISKTEDGKETTLYYGTVEQNLTAVKTSFELPSGLPNGDYTITVYAEKQNGNTETDAANVIGTKDFTKSGSGVAQKGYTITFDQNYTGAPEKTTYTTNAGGRLPRLPADPYRENHTFLGWYTEKDGGEPVTAEKVFDGDTAVYAHWKQNLTFTDRERYDVPEGKVNVAIAEIDVSSAVSGGTAPYTFSKGSGPDWLQVSGEGKITGTPTETADAATAVIKVTDSADSAATAQITINVGAVTESGPSEPEAPTIIGGANGSYSGTMPGGLVFTSSAEFNSFVKVQVDGKDLVRDQDYTVASGSTIVTLKAEYLATLRAGTHVIAIVSDGGTAATEFTVEAASTNPNTPSTPAGPGSPTNPTQPAQKPNGTTSVPQTGDNSSMAVWIILMGVSAAGLGGTVLLQKRRKSKA